MNAAVLPDGFLWNEAILESNHELNHSLFSLGIIGDNLSLTLVGTAFIVTADKSSCVAISAAHCFEEFRAQLHPHKKHHATTPLDFLPTEPEIDLSRAKAFYLKDQTVYVCDLEIAVWDVGTDIAVFRVLAPENDPELFKDFLWLSLKVPAVGESVALVGFGDMKLVEEQADGTFGFQRKLILRVGTVENIYPAGFYLLKAPCLDTTVPVYSGMSGGFMARWNPAGRIEPFAFISHAPDPQPLADRSQSGHSMGSIILSEIITLSDERQLVSIKINKASAGRNSVIPSEKFFPFTQP